MVRLNALGALADLTDSGSNPPDLLESSTINYEDLGIGGSGGNNFQFNQMLLNRNDRAKSEQKSWLNRASELLDLSSGDSRDTPNVNNEESFSGQQAGSGQQSGGQQANYIPQVRIKKKYIYTSRKMILGKVF